uniref:non-specific serine/threonine protein kinase n=1 Tax=Crassostrea virginica TaxID=6565 RepID=A0A8B8AL28_CRAVI|nr:uncharacterized protein LOC111103347 isoform X3 [Crassostrea virginica]
MSDTEPDTAVIDSENQPSEGIQSLDPVERSSDVTSEDKEQGDSEELGEQTSEKKKCGQCLEAEFESEATLICKNENIALCNDCGIRHKLNDSTKCHEIVRLKDDRMICDRCLDSSIPGYGFCIDCKQTNPEVLCLPCSKRHCTKDEFKNHKICTNFDLMKQSERSENDSVQSYLDENTDVDICSNSQYAMKVFDLRTSSEHERNSAEKEAKLLTSLKHEFILHAVTSFQQGEELCIVTEFCDQGDLEQFLKKRNGNLLDDVQIVEWFRQICSALEYVHSRNILHRDLKTKNVFLTGKDMTAKLGDFGLAKVLERSSQRAETFCGSPYYMSPEMFACKPYDSKSDIWALGVCVYEMTTLERPFDANLMQQLVFKIVQGQLPAMPRDKYSLQLVSVMERMMCRDPDKRPSATELLEDDVFRTNEIPGKPMPINIQPDFVEISWRKSRGKVDYYLIRYKSTGGLEKWKFVQTDSDNNRIIITGLMADTRYTFQVRRIFKDHEGIYGPANDDIKTIESPAIGLLNSSIKVTNGNPPKYRPFMQEQVKSRNSIARTRKIIVGKLKQEPTDEKTIILVGEIGSGKSTLVDGIVNYVMGVRFDDPFRFTLMQLEEEERMFDYRIVSQTEWITVYKIAPQKGSRLNYTLNIIDTPGFGNTRGIERDQGVIDQIRQLFSSEGEKGVHFIDAVCFIVKVPDAYLTISQIFISSSIMSLFGKDIESNICTLFTFADGRKPLVLASLKAANLPFGSTFQFNNSALFAENKNLSSTSLSPMFWEMGCNSFQNFFDQLGHFETRSLSQTKDVLKEREQLKTIIANNLPQIKAGLTKLAEHRDQLEIFKKHKDDIDNNKDFEYEVEETKQHFIDLPRGQHVTNCLQCHTTCHDNCRYADDADKRRCSAMTNGYCRVCIGKCIWSDHKNTPYIFRYTLEKVKKTYTEMKQKYEQARGNRLTHETYIEELTYDVDYLFENVKLMMAEMTRCKRRLKEIALRPDPLSAVENIDLMIHAEQTERQLGYRRRTNILNAFRSKALLDEDNSDFDQFLQSTRDAVTTFHGPGRAPN